MSFLGIPFSPPAPPPQAVTNHDLTFNPIRLIRVDFECGSLECGSLLPPLGRGRGGRGEAGRLLTFLSRTALFPVEFSRPADALRGGKRSMTC